MHANLSAAKSTEQRAQAADGRRLFGSRSGGDVRGAGACDSGVVALAQGCSFACQHGNQPRSIRQDLCEWRLGFADALPLPPGLNRRPAAQMPLAAARMLTSRNKNRLHRLARSR